MGGAAGQNPARAAGTGPIAPAQRSSRDFVDPAGVWR